MITRIVQVIAPKRVVGGLERNEPDLGPDIVVTGARVLLPEAWWKTGSPSKYWWVATVTAETVQALVDWNNTPGNIGWIARSHGGTNAALTDSDADKIWEHLRGIIVLETPVGHNLWWVSGAFRNPDGTAGGPDMNDPVVQPTISAHKLLLNLTAYVDKAGFWSGISSATDPQLANWKSANDDLGWKDSLPALLSADGRMLVRKLEQIGNNAVQFAGE
jgi:hypothetical protein